MSFGYCKKKDFYDKNRVSGVVLVSVHSPKKDYSSTLLAAIGRDLSLKSLRSNSALVDAPITEVCLVFDDI